MLYLTRTTFEAARARMRPHVYHTPLVSSAALSRQTGYEVRLKAEMLQRTGSYKIRGPLNKFSYLTEQQKKRGVICSSTGNHAQGVALAAGLHNIRAIAVMAVNATKVKIDATRGYGAEVVLHGSSWEEANEHALKMVDEQGLTFIHPFDDEQLIAGQGTLGWEIYQDWPKVDVALVPIGGGGLIAGVAMALKSLNPRIRIIGVESTGAPSMKRSIEAGSLVTLDRADSRIDGLNVRRAGTLPFEAVKRFVDEIVLVPDEQIFEAIGWIMSRCKLVAEGAAAAPVAALLQGLVTLKAGTKVTCILSGGNIDLQQLQGREWN